MHLGAWPGGSWLPWRAAPLLLCSCSCLVSERLPQEWSYLLFHLFTCTMGFAPIKWTCTDFFRPRQLTDRAILAIRQTQEKNILQTLSARCGEPTTTDELLVSIAHSGLPQVNTALALKDWLLHQLLCQVDGRSWVLWSVGRLSVGSAPASNSVH